MKKTIILAVFCLMGLMGIAYAQNPADYLILQSIGNFSSDGKGKCGTGSGVIGAADHFDEDHNVLTCFTDHYNFQQKMAVEIKVEQHAGGDSDRWLLHEVEDSFRDGEIETVGLLTQGARMREIYGNKIISLRGNGYSWVSNNIIVDVSYRDLDGTKPEPLEVIQTYLAKFPSTITTTPVEFKSEAYNIKWIIDEMERRLWLCDKWNLQFQAGKVTQADLLKELVNNVKIFLNYRQKYFGISATDEITALEGYWESNDAVSIQAKLTSYKSWWLANKSRSISLASNNTSNKWIIGGCLGLAAIIASYLYFRA